MPDGSNSVGISRRGMLQCALMGSAGVLWTVTGGVPHAFRLDGSARAAERAAGDFRFVQISDTHIGFKGAVNPEPGGTLNDALARAVAARPAMLIHTGDVSHLSKPAELDDAAQLMKAARLETFYVPGEHDVIGDDGAAFFERFGRAKGRAQNAGWYSFDAAGVHFVALVNVIDLKAGGLGYLGPAQIEWLENDLKGKSASTPIVVFAHMPLWSVYPEWGWGTDDAAAALAYLKRFGSVTVLNGHIHQVIQKVEGSIVFHTAYSTAFPQAAPGAPGASPGPLKVPAERLRSMLGLRDVEIVRDKPATIRDTPLAM